MTIKNIKASFCVMYEFLHNKPVLRKYIKYDLRFE